MKLVLIGYLAGTFSLIGTVSYIVLSAAGAGASILAPMTSLYVVIPVVAAACVGHRMKVRQGVGVVLSILAAIAFGLADLQGGGERDGGAAQAKTILFLLLVIFAWGIATSSWQFMGGHMGIHEMFAAYSLSALGTVVAGIIAVAAIFRTFDPVFRSEHAIVICSGFAMAIGQVLFISLSSHMRDDAGIVAPLASMYIIWPVIVGLAAFGEGMTWLKALATVATPIAVLLMTVKDFGMLWQEIRNRMTAVRRPRLWGLPLISANATSSDEAKKNHLVAVNTYTGASSAAYASVYPGPPTYGVAGSWVPILSDAPSPRNVQTSIL